MIRSLIPYIVVALVAYLAPIIAGEFRYRRLPSFHTWGAKLCAINAGLALLVLFVTQNSLWFRICIPLLVLESIEELIMIAVLPRWHPNVPSLWHALRLRRGDPDAGKTLPDGPGVGNVHVGLQERVDAGAGGDPLPDQLRPQQAVGTGDGDLHLKPRG